MFQLNFYQYVVAIFLCGLAGFVDSIAGGGGLISMPGYLIIGLPPITASATNKLSAFMGATVTLFNYKKKGFVKLGKAIPYCLVAILSSSIGAKVETLIPEYYLKIFMLIVLPITMLIILNKNSLKAKESNFIECKETFIKILLIAFVIGFYDGIYGPGTGTFLLIALVNIVFMDIKSANGLTKAINWSTNIGALVVFLFSGKVLIMLGILCGVSNMIGSYIGSNLFAKKGVDIAKPIMIIVMIIFIVKIILELLNVI